jgi:hypothetical protein
VLDIAQDTPTALERVTALAALTQHAKDSYTSKDHGILWDALVDAHAALEAAARVVMAVTSDAVLRNPALVCVTCGDHLCPEDAVDRRDYLFVRAHHETGSCASSSNEGQGDR